MTTFNHFIMENGQIVIKNDWIRWQHNVEFDFSNLPTWARIFLNIFEMLLEILNSGHCKICKKLNNCWFVEELMPQLPLHNGCHCAKIKIPKPIANLTSFANMDIRKLTEYIFDDYSSGGKKELFESWGYNINNANQLKNLYEQQAVTNYTNGLYEMHLLDEHGQRISIDINLKGHIIKSGWMVEQNGLIRNITPFGGWK